MNKGNNFEIKLTNVIQTKSAREVIKIVPAALSVSSS